jgi:hypothetical protein
LSDETKPNFMRYQRVADVIATEPALKARMGGKTEVVLKPNGDKVEFPKEVIDVTERIHAIGHDAGSYGKDKIVQLAIDVILHDGNGSTVALPKAVEPKTEPAAPKLRKKRRKAVVQKPAVPEPPAAKPKKPRKKRQPKAKVEAPAAAPVIVPAAAVAEKPKVDPAPVDKKAPAERPKRSKAQPAETVMVAVASPPPQAQNSVVPFAVGCAVNSNLICASQLLEIHDRTLEGKEIKERLDKIIDEINRRTVIPSASRG